MHDNELKHLGGESCTGCAACYNSCSKNCISMTPDSEGFLKPEVNFVDCTGCNSCINTCPVLNNSPLTNSIPEKVYAAWSLNEDTRYNSTSGGVFSEIALQILSKGGRVVGAAYNQESHSVYHCIISKIDDIPLLRQSKYTQSAIGTTYCEIKQYLESNINVLFVGSPCQCAGLSSYLKKNYENLVICDFICRGANSPKAYLSYLEDLENQYQSPIKQIWFKNKQNGWNRFGTKIDFKNRQSYYKDRYNDLFMVGYLKLNLFLRPSCHNCSFKGFPRNSDISLADFWGIKLKDETKNSDLGTSLVMINSKKGEILFREIADNIYKEEHDLEKAISHNICALESVRSGEHRPYFFDNVNNTAFSDLINEILLK